MPHYTVQRKEPTYEKPSQLDMRERIAKEIEDHYAATFAVVIEMRPRGRANFSQLASIDIFHEDEPAGDDDDLPESVRKDQLVDQVMLETEGGDVDGPREVRVYGVAERRNKTVWRVPAWVVGESLSVSPREQGEQASAGTMVTLARVTELAFRTAERAYERVDRTQERNLTLATRALDAINTAMDVNAKSLDLVVKARHEASASSVELARLDLDRTIAQHRHDEETARQESDDELMMFALETMARAYMTDDEKPDAGGDAGDADDDAERKPAAGDIRERCKEAATLGGIFERLTRKTATEVRALFSETEWDGLSEAMRCRTIEQFDSAFGKAFAAIRSRPDGGAGLMHSLAPLLKGAALTLMRLTQGYEKRHKL